MKKIHEDYQEIIAVAIGAIVVFLISLLSGAAFDLAYFWMAVLLSLFIVTVGVAISHVIKKRKMVANDEKTTTKSFYSYWPYEHPPWM